MYERDTTLSSIGDGVSSLCRLIVEFYNIVRFMEQAVNTTISLQNLLRLQSWRLSHVFFLIDFTPAIHGHKTSGILTNFSSSSHPTSKMAAKTRGTASAVPFTVYG
jgi:hypothetical protein